MLDSMVESGLAYRGKGRENELYYLHDSVASAIVADTKREYQPSYSSYHDNPQISQEHQKMIEYYANINNNAINSEFEVCYHTIMLKENFENEFEVTREDFAQFILGALGLSINKKRQICQDYDDLKEYNKAIIAYTRAIEINPKKDEAYYNIGIAYYSLKEYNKAIIAYTKAIEINPKDDEAYYNMGSAYYNLKEYNKAIIAYTKAIEINPKDDGAYNNMGIAYYYLGKFDKAIESYTQALQINPNQSEAYNNLFELQLIQNQAFDSDLQEYYIALFAQNREVFIDYEMLKVLQAIYSNQNYSLSLQAWQEKYQGIGLGNWGWDELGGWIAHIEPSDTKASLLEAVEVFKKISPK
ncbi:MAG: tetratricopeptide repeat protein [Campylobacterota bacterium]|nr:tetratricopeptide repeat protein [Campylobacterota bacterium]